MTTQISGDTGVSQCQPNSVSQADLQSGVVGKGPAFSAVSAGTQSVNSSTDTKVLLTNELFDSDGAYNAANSRFQPTVAGYYQINASAGFSSNVTGMRTCNILKNGLLTVFGSIVPGFTGLNSVANASAVILLNGTTDYIEVGTYQTSGGALNMVAGWSSISGFLVRAA